FSPWVVSSLGSAWRPSKILRCRTRVPLLQSRSNASARQPGAAIWLGRLSVQTGWEVPPCATSAFAPFVWLLLKATRGVTIALVSSSERKWRQPRLATDDPAFVGWHQLV